MLEKLQKKLLDAGYGGVPVAYIYTAGKGEGTLKAADEIGLMIETTDGTCLYPWSAIHRLRIRK